MKHRLLVMSLVAGLTLMASVASADAATMRITIPFSFYAGTEQLPAGDYVFEMASGQIRTGSLVTIRTIEGAGICMLLTQAGTGATSDKLLFNKYGDRHFLSSISIHGFNAGVIMQQLERELWATAGKQQSTITIAQK
jgi:hypothetical protein